jgi:hypothetical protein
VIEIRGKIGVDILDTESGKKNGDALEWAVDITEETIRENGGLNLGAMVLEHLERDTDMYHTLLARIGEKAKMMLGQDVKLTPWPDQEETPKETPT